MQQRPKREKKRAAFTFSPHLFSRVRTAALLEGRKPQKTFLFFSRILGFLPSPKHAFSQGTHIPILLLPLSLEASHLSVMIGSASDSDSLPLLPPHPPDDKASAAAREGGRDLPPQGNVPFSGTSIDLSFCSLRCLVLLVPPPVHLESRGKLSLMQKRK